MKILIGCDVDPVLPPILREPSRVDIWQCLDNLEILLDAVKGALPPVTWLIRCDESIRFSTGDFASGYTTRRQLWQALLAGGHEIGWHMHLMSFDARIGCFGFDVAAAWLADAFAALSAHCEIRSTRTGWDFASNDLFRRLESLGILVDFSALPGNLVWQSAGHDRLLIDWSRCPEEPYHPSPDDYQQPGSMKLLEIPIAQFPNSILGGARRIAGRLKNGSFAMSGLRNRTRMLTERWDSAPRAAGPIMALYFHPEDVRGAGLDNFLSNLKYLRDLPDAEFVTASDAWRLLSRSPPTDAGNRFATAAWPNS